jgi:hypothetical protein
LVHRKKAGGHGRSGSAGLERHVKERAENAAAAILKAVKIAASLSTLHVEEWALGPTAAVATDVIAAESTPTEGCHHAWGRERSKKIKKGHTKRVCSPSSHRQREEREDWK